MIINIPNGFLWDGTKEQLERELGDDFKSYDEEDLVVYTKRRGYEYLLIDQDTIIILGDNFITARYFTKGFFVEVKEPQSVTEPTKSNGLSELENRLLTLVENLALKE